MPATASNARISRDQFTRICAHLLSDAPGILRDRDASNKAMDEESVLLKEMYLRLLQKLGIDQGKEITSTGGFETYGYAYEVAIYELLEKHSARPFDHAKVVGSFLGEALKRT